MGLGYVLSGEPAITPMGAVIPNAVYDAICVRLYKLSTTPAKVKKAIAEALSR